MLYAILKTKEIKMDVFRIFVTTKEIEDHIGELRNVKVRFINEKDFIAKVKNGELSVKNKVILFLEKSFTSTFKKLIDDNYIKLDIRGIDKQKFIRLDYSTSILDNSKYIVLDPFDNIEKNKKVNIFLKLHYANEENNSIIPYKLINKKYFVDNYEDIMASLGDGDLGFDFETHGIQTHNVDSDFEIIGFGVCSLTQGYYVEYRNDNSIDHATFLNTYRRFIKENHRRLWAYYCPFEIMVNYHELNEFIELQDTMVLCIADENSGSLKYASQYYLKSVDWESETNHVKDFIIKDIYDSLPYEEKGNLRNILGDVTHKKLGSALNKTITNSSTSKYEYELGEYESYKNKYFKSAGSTISYLPSKVVSRYCIFDCYNTLRIKNILYEKYKKAYDSFIKNIYLSIPLQNHGLLLDKVGLDSVDTKYEYLLYNLEVLISRFYYTYSTENVGYNVKDLLTETQVLFFKSYGITSTYDISKNIVNGCVNKDVVGYLDYTSLYENIKDEGLRNKIIDLLNTYKNDDSLLKNLTSSTKVIKEINHIINGYDDTIVDKTIDEYFNYNIFDYENIKPKSEVAFNGDFKSLQAFSGYIINKPLTDVLSSLINNYIGITITTGKDLLAVVKNIKSEFKKHLKDYRDSYGNILSKLDRSIKKKTILNSKPEFIKLLEIYFAYELVVKYKIGDNFYDSKTRERYFKYLNRLELNDYILVNSCSNQEELDDIDDLTEDQKYKYSKIKFKQSFLDEYDDIHNKAEDLFNSQIKDILSNYYTIEEVIDLLLNNKVLDSTIFHKSISKEFEFVDYKMLQFDLQKLIKYYTDLDTLHLLNTVDSMDILQNDLSNRIDIPINLVTPSNKQLLNRCIASNYSNIIYNFHKVFKTNKFTLDSYNTYKDVVKFLESRPDAEPTEVTTYVKKTFSLLPQMRTLKYYYNKDSSYIETIDTSFNNDKSFEECSKLMYCINLYYKLDKVRTAYINGNVIAKNTSNFSRIDDKGFTYTKNSNGYKITQSQFKMLSLKTKRSSAGIHTLNKRIEPAEYLNIYKNHIGIYFDLSAAEVRSAAYMSGDITMIELFSSGIDIYNWMREELSELIDRDGYKGIVLGLIYGRSTDSIAKSLGHLNPQIVIDGIDMFKTKFYTLWKFIESQTKYCIENGRINTMLGDKIDVTNYPNSKRATVGMNYSVQGYTSSLVAEGGYNVWKSLYDSGVYVRLINLVHDSLSYSVHSKEFFLVYSKLNDLFIEYLQNKYGIKFKFDLDLFLQHSDKTSIKKIDENTYEFTGDKAIEIVNRLKKFNELEVIEEEKIPNGRHIYQILDDKYVKTPQNIYIKNNFRSYDKSRVIIRV